LADPALICVHLRASAVQK